MSKQLGFAQIPLKLRLVILITLTSLFSFISDIKISLVVFLISAVVLVIGKRIVYKKVLIYILILNTLFLVAGNWLFSPQVESHKSITFFFFNINNSGFQRGLIGALNRNAMILLSFAWLSSIYSLYDIFKSINIVRRYKFVIIVFLKWIQNLQQNITLLYSSIQVRGIGRKSFSIKNKLNQLQLILKAIINGFFIEIGKMTYNGESHRELNTDLALERNGNIKIQGLDILYDDNKDKILSGIDLDLYEGDVVYVAGLNGSGKSTLLKAIAGYIPKIEGIIAKGAIRVSSIDFRAETTISEITKHLRYIVENPGDSIVGLTVGQELDLQTKDMLVATKYAELLEINTLWERDTNSLSGGEQARLIIASLLCSDVKIIILESIIGQLDLKGRQIFIEALKEIILKKNITVIITDQNHSYFKNLVNRVIWLKNGAVFKDTILKNGDLEYNSIQELLYDSQEVALKVNKPKVEHNTEFEQTKVISCKALSVSINDNLILSDVSLDIYSNQCIAVMGANGSGKSTLMLSLAGLLKPTLGEVEQNKLKIGFVFQNCSKQIIEANVIDEISLQFDNNKDEKEKNDKFINYVLNWSSLKPDSSTLELSSSQISLLEICSNIYEKDVVIFDEPTNNFDRENTNKFLFLIDDLLSRKKTVIIITHDTKIAKVCNRFIFIDKGKVAVDTNSYEILFNLKRDYFIYE